MNSTFIFLIQMVLVLYSLYQILFMEDFIQATSLNILVTRFLCAIILHINIEGEVRQSLNMLNHSLFFTKRVGRQLPQVLIALMNFGGTFLCEAANILLLCTIGNAQDIIINMIAFMVIAQIQYYYAKSLQNDAIKEEVKAATLQIKDEIGEAKLRSSDWLIYLVYRTIKTFYDCLYFYFLPFSIVLITFLTSNSIAIREAAIVTQTGSNSTANTTLGNLG